MSRSSCPNRNKTARAFTLIELLVVVAIIAILSSLLIPAMARAKDKGKTVACASNARQLVMAAIMYEQDMQCYATTWPPPLWYTQLQPYVGKKDTVQGEGIFICPSSFQKVASGKGTKVGGYLGFLSYAQNASISSGVKTKSSEVLDPEGTIFYADTDGWDAGLYPDSMGGANVCYRHSGGNERSAETDRGVKGAKGAKRRANGAFVGGHVQLLRAAPLRIFTLARD